MAAGMTIRVANGRVPVVPPSPAAMVVKAPRNNPRRIATMDPYKNRRRSPLDMARARLPFQRRPIAAAAYPRTCNSQTP